MKKEIHIQERGWPGHFIGFASCLFRRNTLIEYGDKRVVVSTVGNYSPEYFDGEYDDFRKQIGIDRYYETMAFWAINDGKYWEADVSREYQFKSNWAINELKKETDLKADAMHEAVVKEIVQSLTEPKARKPKSPKQVNKKK